MFYKLITRLLALFIKLHSIHLVFLFETYPNVTIKYDESVINDSLITVNDYIFNGE